MKRIIRQHFFAQIYELFIRKKAPYWLRKNSLLFLVWIIVRKYLNVSVIPFIPFNFLRIWMYRLIGYKIGNGCFIGMMCYLDDCLPELMEIRDKVVVSYRVTFAVHGPSKGTCKNRPIYLEEGCYIGTGAIILSGVTIGRRSIVGAGSVITHDVRPETVVVGVHSKELKKID